MALDPGPRRAKTRDERGTEEDAIVTAFGGPCKWDETESIEAVLLLVAWFGWIRFTTDSPLFFTLFPSSLPLRYR
jgi:hypothetical protein